MAAEIDVTLRKTVANDLESLFTFQLDEEANHLAAFGAKDPTDKNAYLLKYAKFLTDPTINMMTISVEKIIAGSIAKFETAGEANVTYWIDKKFWGQGIATRALRSFLMMETTRPIFARAAHDNVGSQRVIEKCGFVRIGKDVGFAPARQKETEEYVYKLV